MAQISEDRGINKRKNYNCNNEIRHANCEGKKKLIEIILSGRECLSLLTENLKGFRLTRLKLQFHLETIDIHF